MTELDEERWRTIRKGIAPAYSMVAIRWVLIQGMGTDETLGLAGGGTAVAIR
jgi:hypothetical protein